MKIEQNSRHTEDNQRNGL